MSTAKSLHDLNDRTEATQQVKSERRKQHNAQAASHAASLQVAGAVNAMAKRMQHHHAYVLLSICVDPVVDLVSLRWSQALRARASRPRCQTDT
jgi:hypothetical protein